jgi:hypothetical protein
METAVRNFVVYRASDDAPMLGRFVSPVSRLDELASALESSGAMGVRISAILGTDVVADLRAIVEFNERVARDAAVIDSVESRADTSDAIDDLASRASAFDVFVELALDYELESLVGAVARNGLRAKIRTGGVTPTMFPTSVAVVRFIRTCLNAGVPFKATAGLHHPFTGSYPLTYESDSVRGTMFGFLNVLLAAAFLRDGMADADASRVLDENDASVFSFAGDRIAWRGHVVDSARLAATHAQVFGSFGSCSFREPVDELRAMALLP